MGNPAGVRRDFQALGHRRLRAARLLAKGNSSVRGGAADRRAPAIGESVGATTGSGRMARSKESRARRTQTPPERRGLEEDPARAEAWAGSIGLRDRTVDGVAGGALDRGGMRGPLPYFAGLAHSAATGSELPASGRTGSGAVSAMPVLRQLPEIRGGSALCLCCSKEEREKDRLLPFCCASRRQGLCLQAAWGL
jgi:hypothetical protein